MAATACGSPLMSTWESALLSETSDSERVAEGEAAGV
jgi:hypothetical protein